MVVNGRAVMVERAPVARPFIVLLLLVGLWLMHAMSGATDAGCHGVGMPIPLSMFGSDAAPGDAEDHVAMPGVVSAAGSRAVAPSVGAALAASVRHGDLCQSGQPPTPGRDALALLALLALGCLIAARDVARDPFGLRLARRVGKRAPPGLFGTGLLTAVCVSRT